MRLPKFLQRLACQYGKHDWKRPRRVDGFLHRSCATCSARQAQHFPGGAWRFAPPRPKRVRRKKESAALAVSEIRQDNVTRGGTAEIGAAVKLENVVTHSRGGL